MYRVLMPVDGSESRGARQARMVTALPGASNEFRVTLLYVFDDEDQEESTSVRQVTGGRAATSRLQEAGVTVKYVSRVGDPATQILAVADEIDADHLVLGGRKRSPLGSLLFGSVTQEVVLDADKPVTITGGEKEATER